jgi:hypothetical protein
MRDWEPEENISKSRLMKLFWDNIPGGRSCMQADSIKRPDDSFIGEYCLYLICSILYIYICDFQTNAIGYLLLNLGTKKKKINKTTMKMKTKMMMKMNKMKKKKKMKMNKEVLPR